MDITELSAAAEAAITQLRANAAANAPVGSLTADQIVAALRPLPRSEWSKVLLEVARDHPLAPAEARRTDKNIPVYAFPDIGDDNAKRLYVIGSHTAPIVFSYFTGDKRGKMILPQDYANEDQVDAEHLADYRSNWARIWEMQACSADQANQIFQLIHGAAPGPADDVPMAVNQIDGAFMDGTRLINPGLMYYRHRIFFSPAVQAQAAAINRKRKATFAVKKAKKSAVEVKKRNKRRLTSLTTQTVAADAEYTQRMNGLIGYATRGLNRKKKVRKAAMNA